MRIISLFVLILMFASCSSTKVLGTWTKSEGKHYDYHKIAILGLAHDAATRKVFEVAVEEQMLSKGFAAEGALDFLPPNVNEDNTSPELIKAFFKSAGVDAVLTISVLEVDDSRRYVPGEIVYMPYYYTYTFYDHYYEYYEYVYAPGYFTGELDVFFEANLFDFETGELIWSAQTETMDLNKLDEIVHSFAAVLVDDLVKSDILVAHSAD
jgi:hypothetical protein